MESIPKIFGRSETLSLLKRRLTDVKEGYRQNLALVGNPYVGKSTVLYHFATNVDDHDVIIVYLDLEERGFSYFYSKLIGSLLHAYAKSRGLPLSEDINVLLETVKNHIPHTVQVIKQLQKSFQLGKHSTCYLGLLTLPEVFTNETGKFCVLILDEFQNIEDFGFSGAFQNLGKKIMTQKRCFYIVSSSYPSLAQKILSEKLSLLFGNFEVVTVDTLDLKSSQEFIEHSVGENKIGVQLCNFLTDFTGGYPLYLDLICQELVDLSALHRQNEIYMPLVSQAIENTIFHKWGVISRHFELIIQEIINEKNNAIIPNMLMALANGKYKVSEVIKATTITEVKVRQNLNYLLGRGIVVKNGAFYYLKDKLFKYWVKYVYQRRLKEVELTPNYLRRQFKEELNRAMETFKADSRKDFHQRITDLVSCFDNEAFELNGRRYKLPVFSEVTPLKLRNDSGNYLDLIKATTDRNTWVIISKKDGLNEADVSAILQEAKKMPLKPERCLIISLSALEDTVKLRALQEKFWVWNEAELKTLLTLFDKSYIV